MSERVTMADVAREAGVSLMTVSRVVNHKGDVSPDTQRRVLAIIDRLGYRPSGIARGLATRQTRTLGLVIPDVANAFFASVARGAESQAYSQDYNVFLCNTNEDPQREVDALQSLDEKRVDGVVLCSSRLGEDELGRLLGRHPAVVLVNRLFDGGGVGMVVIDDECGGRLATQHLLGTGHRGIGLLAGPTTSYSGRQRAKGYHAALAEAGVSEGAGWVQHCAPTVDGGQGAARRLLTTQPELTALVCYNDLVAVGALQTCAELGRRVPADVALVGYDDIPLAELVAPPLTTCRVPGDELGQRAVQLLLGQIGGTSEGGGRVVLRPELIVRASAPWRSASAIGGVEELR
jgi:LacI family transcriptional regulator